MERPQIQHLLLVALFLIPPTDLPAQVPTPVHVVIVVEENHDYSQIIGSAAAPYINLLAEETNGALFTQSYALTHPSQPNYLMLFSGSDHGVTGDYLPGALPYSSANLGASLINSGKTFAGYSEDLPYVGFADTYSGAYARKHNPWVNWQGGSTNGIPAASNLPLTSFPAQFASLPTVSFVIPNEDNDMHNGDDPATITTGDTWLQSHLGDYIRWAKTNNSLFILTYDEGTTWGSNRIVTLFVGAMVKPGRYNETINHYSVLRTIEDFYGLPHAGASSTATPIVDCWIAEGVPIQLVSFSGAYNAMNNSVSLTWKTLSETHNYGFEVQRECTGEPGFSGLPDGFVPGQGTTLQPQAYSFNDTHPVPGRSSYRLKQIDMDNTVHFAEPIVVDVLTGIDGEESQPTDFELEQNYPNPFNPSTTIGYTVAGTGHGAIGTRWVKLAVYDMLGREVAVLVNEKRMPGRYEVRFDASALSSGVYCYRIHVRPLASIIGRDPKAGAGELIQTRRLLLIR
jgi:phosphatidylinositol-3-phosphatase